MTRGKKRKIIDIGCGINKYPNSFGIDINPDFKPDKVWDCNNGLPFIESGSVDFINCNNALEHFKNPYFALQECYRVLKKNGEMRLIVPNCQFLPLIFVNAIADIGRFWDCYMRRAPKKKWGVHYTLFTKYLLSLLAREVGFKIVSADGWLYGKEISLLLKKVK